MTCPILGFGELQSSIDVLRLKVAVDNDGGSAESVVAEVLGVTRAYRIAPRLCCPISIQRNRAQVRKLCTSSVPAAAFGTNRVHSKCRTPSEVGPASSIDP